MGRQNNFGNEVTSCVIQAAASPPHSPQTRRPSLIIPQILKALSEAGGAMKKSELIGVLRAVPGPNGRPRQASVFYRALTELEMDGALTMDKSTGLVKRATHP